MQKRVVVTAGTTLDNRVATRFDSPKERKHWNFFWKGIIKSHSTPPRGGQG
jgi:hypothetical protein